MKKIRIIALIGAAVLMTACGSNDAPEQANDTPEYAHTQPSHMNNNKPNNTLYHK